jgi:hypothetical protein
LSDVVAAIPVHTLPGSVQIEIGLRHDR